MERSCPRRLPLASWPPLVVLPFSPRDGCVAKPRACVVSSRNMSALPELLSSKARAEVFRLLFGTKLAELHGRDLARRSTVSEASLRQELGKLRRLGIVSARRDGNRLYYRAERAHPLFPEIHRLVLKTSGLVEVLRQALGSEDVTVAFVFGSVAEGTSTANSDVDLMVIGSTTIRRLAVALQGVAEQIGREVNPHVLTEDELKRRLARGEHFATHVISGPKLFVVGTEDEFAAMGSERLAEA